MVELSNGISNWMRMPFHRLTIEAQTFAVVQHFATVHVLLMRHPLQVLHAVV